MVPGLRAATLRRMDPDERTLAVELITVRDIDGKFKPPVAARRPLIGRQAL